MAGWKKDGSSWTKKWEDDTQKEKKWEEGKWSDTSTTWKKATGKDGQWQKRASASDAMWTPESKKKTDESWTESWTEASPTGKAKPETKLPDKFHPSKTHFDTNQVFGKDFPKVIAGTAWARQFGFQGRSYESIRLHELCYFGWSNISLRYMMNGIFTSIIFTRSVKESIFGDRLLKALRSEHIDIDEVTNNAFSKEKGHPPRNKEEKEEAMSTVISSIVAKMKESTVSTANEELMEKVRAMELELAAAKGVTTTKRKNSTAHPGLPIDEEKEDKQAEEQNSAEEGEGSPKRKKTHFTL